MMRDCRVLPKHAHAILFEEEINLDEDLTKMIKNSFLINSITNISINTQIIPKTTTLGMKIYARDREEEYFQNILFAINKLDEIHSTTPNNIKIGSYLEYAVEGIINARLNVLMRLQYVDNQKVEIFGRIRKLLLLDINNVKGISDKMEDTLNMKFLVPLGILDLKKIHLSNSYIKSRKHSFLRDANVTPGRIFDIMQIIPSPDECFDYGFMVYSAYDKKPFAVFINTKSGREINNEVDTANSIQSIDKIKFDYCDLLKGGEQAKHLLKKASSSSLGKRKVIEGSLLEALKNKNFLYIYVNTSKDSISFGVNDNVMQLGEIDSKHLLSFLLDAYRHID
jgi:hypothetical protein